MGLKRNIAHKLAGYAYRFQRMPFRNAVLKWDIKLQVLFIEYLDGEIKQPPKLWWHSSVYRIGMWFADKNRSLKSQRFGEWVVHKIPYNIRFDLA